MTYPDAREVRAVGELSFDRTIEESLLGLGAGHDHLTSGRIEMVTGTTGGGAPFADLDWRATVLL
jgi:hypothetical protein